LLCTDCPRFEKCQSSVKGVIAPTNIKDMYRGGFHNGTKTISKNEFDKLIEDKNVTYVDTDTPEEIKNYCKNDVKVTKRLAKAMLNSEYGKLQQTINRQIKERGYFQLKDVQTLSEISKIYKIDRRTLDYRLKHLIEGVDYIKLGSRQPTLLTPLGVEKILNVKGVKL